MHILLVFTVALAVFAAGALNGNVLCIGDDGHVAVETPHQPPAVASTALPGQQQPEHDAEHGPCSDIAVDVEVAVRQTAIGTLDTPTVVPPVLDLPLPVILVVRDHPVRTADYSPEDHPSAVLGCIRSVVLLT